MTRLSPLLFPRLIPLFAPLLAVLAACGSAPPPIQTEAVSLRLGRDLNDDQPLAVDLVYVGDKELADRLAKITAREWFRSRDQYRRDYPRGLVIHGWELVPAGGEIRERIAGELGDSIGMFLFADYGVAGDHRARLDLLSRPVVWLRAHDFRIEEDTDASR